MERIYAIVLLTTQLLTSCSWMAESTRVDHDHMSPVVRSMVYDYSILSWRNVTGASPWRAKSRLAGDESMSLWRAMSRLAERCGSVAMASYVSPGGTMSEQTTGLRTFSPKILFFIMLSPNYDWNNNVKHVLGSIIHSYIKFVTPHFYLIIFSWCLSIFIWFYMTIFDIYDLDMILCKIYDLVWIVWYLVWW